MADVLSINDLRLIVHPLLKQHGLKSALLFGSYAREEASDGSDVDLIVERGENSRRLSVYALGKDIRELTGKRVDIFNLTELDDGPFKHAVSSEAIAL